MATYADKRGSFGHEMVKSRIVVKNVEDLREEERFGCPRAPCG